MVITHILALVDLKGYSAHFAILYDARPLIIFSFLDFPENTRNFIKLAKFHSVEMSLSFGQSLA